MHINKLSICSNMNISVPHQLIYIIVNHLLYLQRHIFLEQEVIIHPLQSTILIMFSDTQRGLPPALNVKSFLSTHNFVSNILLVFLDNHFELDFPHILNCAHSLSRLEWLTPFLSVKGVYIWRITNLGRKNSSALSNGDQISLPSPLKRHN